MSLISVPVPADNLSPEAIKKIEAKLGGMANPQINSGTSHLEAGQKLGVQLVLRILRDGWHNQ